MTTTWNIDTTHTTIGFTIRHMVFTKVRGRFLKFAGAIQLEDDLAKSTVEVAVDVASIDTGTAQRDTHLRSADFFNVETFPELRFRSTLIEDAGGGELRVTGDLTIRDVTRQVTLTAESAGRGKDPWGGERIGFTAKTAIDRKDFGLTYNQVLETGGLLVGDKVEIELEVQAVKAAARDLAA